MPAVILPTKFVVFQSTQKRLRPLCSCSATPLLILMHTRSRYIRLSICSPSTMRIRMAFLWSFFKFTLTLKAEYCMRSSTEERKCNCSAHFRVTIVMTISLSASHMHSLSIGPFGSWLKETGGVCPFPTADQSAHGKRTNATPTEREEE